MSDFESLVGRIYEASADPELWSGVLRDIAGSVDAVGGIILTRRSDFWLGWRRVACGVAEGLTPEQIAARQGTTRETVRGQLKSVFGKTGVTREAQLAALLAAQGGAPIRPSGEGE
jgi:DNA-binding CsgD family transcriptional regulator